ncbi:MAG: glycosyltransferase [Candidatus Thermoplasmatota archaeon]|jgi:cellulose synthase/poly-beta-1,6-N-acetylglucosamine synthase-like glycosyltransferase|nr:glycosyltransferase [Candidatus Thermoplasmatota archaeon]MCL5785707.1 glycosyltransferase [Candidatus Thermoplasmatota archaeon]
MLWLYFEIAIAAISFISFAFYMYSAGTSLFFPTQKEDFTHSVAEVTVVIPVFNEDEALFRSVVESVRRNEVRFLVVGDRCLEPYKEITESRGGTFINNVMGPGKKGAIATGISHVDTRFVLFLDSDAILPPGGVQSLVNNFGPTIGGCSGIIRVHRDGRGISYSAEFVERSREVILRSMNAHGNVMILDGCCAMYRADLVRPFMLSDEFLKDTFAGKPVVTGDDRRLTSLVIRSGFKAIRDFSVKVEVPAPKNVKTYVRQQVRWSRSGWLSFFRDVKNGTAMRAGRFYNVTLFYVYLVPLIMFALLALRLSLPFVWVITYRPQLFLHDPFGVLVKLTWFSIFSGFSVKDLGLIHFLRVLGTALAMVGASAFGIAISDTMIKERLKTFVYGMFAMMVMFIVNVYGLLTIWKQYSWMTREIPAGELELSGNDPGKVVDF